MTGYDFSRFALDRGFEEGDHPRDEGGRFAESGGGKAKTHGQRAAEHDEQADRHGAEVDRLRAKAYGLPRGSKERAEADAATAAHAAAWEAHTRAERHFARRGDPEVGERLAREAREATAAAHGKRRYDFSPFAADTIFSLAGATGARA